MGRRVRIGSSVRLPPIRVVHVDTNLGGPARVCSVDGLANRGDEGVNWVWGWFGGPGSGLRPK